MQASRVLTRRALLSAVTAALPLGCVRGHSSRRVDRPKHDPFSAIEERIGGRVGVYALDTGKGEIAAHRADERFAMCSTFKWALVAAVLSRVDRRELDLQEHVTFTAEDLLEYAPRARANLGQGFMTLDALCEASVVVSDNTASNLLLARVGGPVGLTQFFRRLGDEVTRLDRDEPTLNTNLRGDPRDTTSPRAMVTALRAALIGPTLTPRSRERLTGWLKACETGRERLRAGLPASLVAGDKTGTGANGAANDVAVVWPPQRPPILIAAYLSDGPSEIATLNAAHREIGALVVALAGKRV